MHINLQLQTFVFVHLGKYMGVDLDLGYAGIVGQGRRSKVKSSKSCVDITVTCPLPCFEVKVKSRGQCLRSGSMSTVGVKVKVECLARSGRY